MMQIFVGLGDPKNLSTILLCRGDLLPERVQILAWFWNGVRGGPLEKRRSNDAGSAALTSSMAKARAMACGSNPRALPDIRGDATTADTPSLEALEGVKSCDDFWLRF